MCKSSDNKTEFFSAPSVAEKQTTKLNFFQLKVLSLNEMKDISRNTSPLLFKEAYKTVFFPAALRAAISLRYFRQTPGEGTP